MFVSLVIVGDTTKSLVAGERRFATADQHNFAIKQIAKDVVVQAEFLRGVDLLVHDHDPWWVVSSEIKAQNP